MKYVLEMTGITKLFPGVRALNEVDFNLIKGEIHALVGENGAGKSTLMKILGGVYSPDSGTIKLKDNEIKFSSPAEAIKNKIGIIYQEFNLSPTQSIAENIFLGKEISNNWKISNKQKMLNEASIIMQRLGVEIDCSTKVKYLSIAMQQMVEIAKAISYDIEILVMDEPTAVLTDKETESLFKVINSLKNEGISIIYISHRLEEVLSLADRITVLRDGEKIDSFDNVSSVVTKAMIVDCMVGRKIDDYYPSRMKLPENEVILKVEELTNNKIFKNVNFELKKGEILGFSGLVGSGRSEIMMAIFGCDNSAHGNIYINGELVEITSPQQAIEHGIALVPEDRKQQGLILQMSLKENICLPNIAKLSKLGIVQEAKRKQLASESIKDLDIRPSGYERKIEYFSGGNQQKAVISKWLAMKPKIIILDEPTRGIDVGAKIEIYNLINQLADQGVSIIIVSSELPELIGVCDRIIVIREGEVSAEFDQQDFTQEKIMIASVR